MKTVLATFAAIALTTAAYAAIPDFSTADANGDGQVSMDELKAAAPDVTDDQVTAADKNGDGQLDEEEYAALANM